MVPAVQNTSTKKKPCVSVEKLNKKMESISREKTLWETVTEKATPKITSTEPPGAAAHSQGPGTVTSWKGRGRLWPGRGQGRQDPGARALLRHLSGDGSLTALPAGLRCRLCLPG